MLMKKQVNLTAMTRGVSKVSKEELLESSYALKLAELNQAIRDLPKDCPFVKQPQAVVAHVKSLKESNAFFQYPIETLLQTLDMTIALLKPTTMSLEDVNVELDEQDIDLEQDFGPTEQEKAYIKLLQNYHDYGSKLKLMGGLKILGGLMCILAAAVLIAVIVVALFLLSPMAGPLTVKLGTKALVGVFFGNWMLSALSIFSVVQAVKHITNGLKSIALANSMQKFLAKVNEPAPLAPFQQGFKLLNENPEKALESFAAVKEGDPQYTQAQSMIAAYTPTSAGVPHSPNIENLLATDSSVNLEKRKQAKAEREGYSVADQVADDVQPLATARRKLNLDSSEDVQVLIGEVIDYQQSRSLN